MSFDVMMKNISNQIGQLEQNADKITPEMGLDQLNEIGQNIRDALKEVGENVNPETMIATQMLMNRVVQLNDKFIEKTEYGKAVKEMKNIMKINL